MKSKEGTPSAVEIADHCLIAFGAGAGTSNITPGALRAIRDRYFDAVTSLADTWDKDGESVLLNTRELGRICAELASKSGKTAIDVDHFKQAIIELRQLWEGQMFPVCPCALE